jgi:hypothetical protein
MAQAKSVPVSLGKIPREGPMAYPITLDFTAATLLNVNLNLTEFGMSTVQSVFVDNSNNASQLSIIFAGVNQTLVLPPYSQATFPFLFLGPNLQFQASTAGGVAVKMAIVNVEQQLNIWYVTQFGGGGSITVTGSVTTLPNIGAFTDRSGSVTTGGTSQQAAAANGSRKRLIILNPSDPTGQNIATIESLFVNFGTAAALNTGGAGASLEIPPGASLDLNNGTIVSSAVNVTAATTGHYFIVKEI